MAENLNGTGAMPLGLGAAMLKWLGDPDVGQGLGAMLNSGATSAAAWPPSGAGSSMMGDQDVGPSGPVQPPNLRLTPENIERFARILQSECGGTCNPAELQGVGSTIMNRMDRDKTDSVSDASKGTYALDKDPTDPMKDVALRMLSGQLARNTDATHFYSPRSMPKPGIAWNGPKQDTEGGMELVHGQGVSDDLTALRKLGTEPSGIPGMDGPIDPSLKDAPQLELWNLRPKFSKDYPQASIPGVRDWHFKFYTQPRKGWVY